MGYPQGPVTLKEPLPVMDLAKKLAADVRLGRKTGDKAIRDLIARLSYFRSDTERMPVYSAKLISAASDLIYSAELRSPSYRDPAEEDALRVLKDAAMEARGGTWVE